LARGDQRDPRRAAVAQYSEHDRAGDVGLARVGRDEAGAGAAGRSAGGGEVAQLEAARLGVLELVAVRLEHRGAPLLAGAGDDALGVAREQLAELGAVLLAVGGCELVRERLDLALVDRRARLAALATAVAPREERNRDRGGGERQRARDHRAHAAADPPPRAVAERQRRARLARRPVVGGGNDGGDRGPSVRRAAVVPAAVDRRVLVARGGGAARDRPLALGDGSALRGGERSAAEVARREVAPLRVLLQRAGDHAIEAGRHVAGDLGRPRRRVVHVREHRRRHRAARVRDLAGQRVEQHAAERIDVRARVDLSAGELLGRHEVDGSDPLPGRRQPRVAADQLREAEVRQVRVLAAE
jgi:hypothetical protein